MFHKIIFTFALLLTLPQISQAAKLELQLDDLKGLTFQCFGQERGAVTRMAIHFQNDDAVSWVVSENDKGDVLQGSSTSLVFNPKQELFEIYLEESNMVMIINGDEFEDTEANEYLQKEYQLTVIRPWLTFLFGAEVRGGYFDQAECYVTSSLPQ